MKIGYVRISKTDESQTLDLQLEALVTAAVKTANTMEGHGWHPCSPDNIEDERRVKHMVITTTPAIEGHPVEKITVWLPVKP